MEDSDSPGAGRVAIIALQLVGIVGAAVWGVSVWVSSSASAERSASATSDVPIPTAIIEPDPAPPAPSVPPALVDAAGASAPAPIPNAITARVDPAWVQQVSASADIPPRMLRAYAGASIAIAAEQPTCNLGWNTLAAIGRIESNDGRYGGAAVSESGYSDRRIVGPELSGGSFAAIRDTDRGLWDGDSTWDRAVGPFQFIPQTWAQWGADGNGDGLTEPAQVDDAALAAARYLCHAGDLSDPTAWRAAIFSYNHSDTYVDDVAAMANQFAAAAGRR